MNKIKVFFACCSIAFFTTVRAGDYTTEDVQNAVLLINHINWVVSKITNYNNVVVLEEEYDGITANNLVLSSIKDQETIDLIKSIMDVITSSRINEGDRKILQEIYELEVANAIYDSIPSASAIISPNIIALSINLIQSSASSYANYKRVQGQLSIRLKKDTWGLDKEKLKYLNGLNKDLLEQQWKLTNRYKFADDWRVSDKDITELINRLKDTDNKRTYEYLVSEQNRFEKLPVFWYYLGVYALKENRDDKALEAFEKFEIENRQILRRDKIAASVAMNKIRLLLKEKSNDLKIRKQLAIIEKNSQNWEHLYFCALVLKSELKDDKEAERVLRKVINNLEFVQENKLKAYRDLYRSNDVAVKENPIPIADGLMISRMLLMQILGEENRDNASVKNELDLICTLDTTSNIEQLYYIGQLKIEQIFKNLLNDIRIIYLEHESKWMRTDDFIAYIPLKWFLVGDVKPKLELYSDDKLVTTLKEDTICREVVDSQRTNKFIEHKVDMVKVYFKYEGDWLKDKKINRMELVLSHKYCPVIIGFDSSLILKKTDKKWLLSYNRMLANNAKFMGKVYDISPIEKSEGEKEEEKKTNTKDTLLTLSPLLIFI